MKRKIRSLGLGFIALTTALLLISCAPQNPVPKPATEYAGVSQEKPSDSAGLPVRYQTPNYSVKPLSSASEFGNSEDSVVPVGADFTSTVPISLRDIMKQLAQIKGMNISWANDVDQTATVDVNIRAEEDFFKSISNLLRQLDYFLEVRGNTLVIMHKAVRKYHIAMPFVATKFSSGVGGDVLGSSGQAGNMQGKLELTSEGNEFDIWKNIQENLDKVLEIWETPTPKATPPPPSASGQQQTAEKAAPAPSRPPIGKGYYTIDKPIGLITVTAPPSLLDKIDSYINNLKAELYRQVVIEAKIVEVTLDEDNTSGINWDDLLSGANFDFNLDFQKFSPTGTSTYGQFLTLNNKSFSLFLDAVKSQGTTNVIANPKISVMNGQPAMINIGENVTYIDSVTSTINASGGTPIVTYSVNTGTILSGVVLSVVPTIMENNEIILSLAPVTSQLQEPIQYIGFGNNNQVGLPRVNIREMSTMVRLKDQEMLVVGGLIDNSDTEKEDKIHGLGDIPGLGKLFGSGGKVKKHKELVIFLKPRIVS